MMKKNHFFVASVFIAMLMICFIGCEQSVYKVETQSNLPTIPVPTNLSLAAGVLQEPYVQVETPGIDSIFIQWATRPNEYYNVYWGTDPNVQGAVKFTTDTGFAGPGSPIQYTIPDLQTGTIYHIWIEAKFEDSDIAETTKIDVETILASPVLTVTGVGSHVITFEWNSISGASSYLIEHTTDNPLVLGSFELDASKTSWDIHRLSKGHPYSIVVFAVSATGKKYIDGNSVKRTWTRIDSPERPETVHTTGNQVSITFPPVEGPDNITYQYAATHVLTNGKPNSNLTNPVIIQFYPDGTRRWNGYPPIWQDVISSDNITLETGNSLVYIRSVQKDINGDIVNASRISSVARVTVP